MVILAPGTGIAGFEQVSPPMVTRAARSPSARQRGQRTQGGGVPRRLCVSPAFDGLRCAGATFAVDDFDPGLRPQDHVENLQRLRPCCPASARAWAWASTPRGSMAAWGSVPPRPTACR